MRLEAKTACIFLCQLINTDIRMKPGCTDVQISNALKAQGGAGNGDGSESSDGFDNGGCEVRLDSGFPMGNQLTHPGSRSARCWTPADATTDIQRITGNAL